MELLTASTAKFSPVFAAEFSSVEAFLREPFCFAILSFTMVVSLKFILKISENAALDKYSKRLHYLILIDKI